MDNAWRDRVVAVTGAASGIGRALARALSERGARLALSDVQDDALAEVAAGLGGDVRTYHLDVSDREAVLAHAEQVLVDFGVVHGLFNNAGVALAARALEQRFEDVDWLLGINLYGVINGTQAFLPHLIASGAGRLVNISSVFGLIGVPGQSAYNAAKFGVRGYTEAVAMEMALEAHPVTVHCVHPGGIRTNIVRNARTDEGTDSAELVRFFDSVARTEPHEAARQILRGVERGRPRILVGPDAHLIHGLSNLLGGRYHGAVTRSARQWMPAARTERPKPVASEPIQTRVAIIGAGFSGLGAAIKLDQAGISDFVILDDGHEVGGTWRDNRYPGAACDIPSHLYSFSFEPFDWSEEYASQPEILRYLIHLSRAYGLRDRLYLRRRVTRAVWEGERWRLTCNTGETVIATALIAGIGGLRDPAWPEIPGREQFEGVALHSARWDPDVPLAGQRVGVIGTGASAIQIVPAVAERAGHLTLFQRTPAWVVPRHNRPYSPAERLAFKALPGARRLKRWSQYLSHEARYLAFGPLTRVIKPLAERTARRHMARAIDDERLRRHLTPDYDIGCKRVLVDDHYYPALTRDNVSLVTAPIAEITPGGVRTDDGVEHALDVLAFATGFRIDQPLGDLEVHGVGGTRLSDAWRDRPSAYLGMTVPRFPNLFMMVGPNSGLGHNSVLFMIEAQLRYLIPAVKRIVRDGVTLTLRDEALEDFRAEVDRRTGDTVWASGCRSWYLTPDGRNFTLWPGSTLEYWWRTRRFDPTPYHLAPRGL